MLAQLSFPGFPSNQLPYLIDGAHKITQSNAILRYIARKHNLCDPHILDIIQITFVDFIAYDVLERNQVFEPTCLDAFPNLKDFISRFEGLEKISAYMKSSRFLPRPVFTKMAVWGNK
ncbi:hypothetical protein P7K49_016374 [Saguinus oedipus]|uniref:glutathione transferase n=1 Tax=Saguinus oedipus TaxID=9490 RepID=A0ABQ9VCP7_SAGOE|nr:hypothetical protein P7K49_016374 [Saguinus oedipus]